MARQPSELLESLASVHQPAAYQKIIREDVYPFLDGLPTDAKSSLVGILEKAYAQYEGIGLVAFESRSKAIASEIKDLKKHVKNDWHDGYEEQAEMMEIIAQKIAEWVPILWTVGVEKGVELELIHKALQFCYNNINAAQSTNSRADWGDAVDDVKVTILNAAGEVVYKVDHVYEYNLVETSIMWVWRELLLSAIVHRDDEALAKTFVADIVKLKLVPEMLKRLSDEIVTAPGQPMPVETRPDENPWRATDRAQTRRDTLMNAHWTPEMRAAVPRVKALFVSDQIAQFKEKPHPNVYDTLVKASPDLQEDLLAHMRSCVFQTSRVEPMRDDDDEAYFVPPRGYGTSLRSMHPAFYVFLAAHSEEDLLCLLDLSETGTQRHLWEGQDDNKQKAVSFLMTRSNDVRARTRPHLEHALRRAQENVKYTMYDVFPSLPDAWRYLETQVHEGHLAASVPYSPPPPPSPPRMYAFEVEKVHNGVHPRPADPARDPILKQFCDKAGWDMGYLAYSDDDESDSEDRYSDEERYDDGEASEDRAEQEDIAVDAIKTLIAWAKILEQWPDARERDEIKERMRAEWDGEPNGPGRSFFDVDGAADALARRCDWGSKPCRQRLGRAIRQVYYSFAKDGAEKERVQRDLPEDLSFYVVSADNPGMSYGKISYSTIYIN
ncbi:hypothetical protein PLICRDRAFT_45025 [Plicaturopsis crispa FD-325 SS-3]|nr:hypothetical protein PLICRDRAFT_45025 [Plicaturopsis crispa FD-325 SS-3]